jgi:hypothetical protein
VAQALRADGLDADQLQRQLAQMTPQERLALFEYLDASREKAAPSRPRTTDPRANYRGDGRASSFAK